METNGLTWEQLEVFRLLKNQPEMHGNAEAMALVAYMEKSHED